MLRYPYLELRFQPTANCDLTEDHVVSIREDFADGGFYWLYKDPSVNKHHYMHIDSLAALEYQLDGLFSLLSWDAEPFSAVQLTSPGFPPVLFRMQDTQEALHDIKKFIGLLADNWPERLDGKEFTKELRNEDDLVEQEEDEDDSESESESEEESAPSEVSDPNQRDSAAAAADALNALRNYISDCPALNTRNRSNQRRTVTQTSRGLRVHTRF